MGGALTIFFWVLVAILVLILITGTVMYMKRRSAGHTLANSTFGNDTVSNPDKNSTMGSIKRYDYSPTPHAAAGPMRDDGTIDTRGDR